MEPLDLAGRIEPTSRRIRGLRNGRALVDTTDARLVFEHGYYPHYLVPDDDVDAGFEASTTEPVERPPANDRLGPAKHLDLVFADGERLRDAGWTWPGRDDARDHIRLRWSLVDTWLEEDQPVIVHPRSPYVRIDALPSSQTVRIEVEGTVLAESSRAVLLFETNLPRRWYLPLTDVATERLVPSDTTSQCPYKGTARYHSVRVGDTVHDDLVWYYDAPLPESQGIIGRVCFYDEKVDVFVDGNQQ